MKFKSILFVIVFVGCRLTASANYNFDARCMDAYKAVFDFRLNDARAIIQQEKQQYPQNGITILLDNYVDYISLITSDNKNEYDLLKDKKSDRIDALKGNEENSPYYLYAQAEVYLQWGLIKAKFGDYTSSASDFKKARNLLNDNTEKYPDFLPAQKDLALINVVFGAMPSNLKTFAKFLGMGGNVQAGVAQLEKLRTQISATKYSYYKDEVIFYLCYMDIDVLHNKNNYNRLMGYIAGMDNKDLLRTYLQGYVAAKTGHNEEAIANLQDVPHSAKYTPLPTLDYLLGCAKLCRMDSDAYVYLLKYIDEYKGVNYIKDSYLKVAYCYFFRNDEAKYNYYLKLARTKGYTTDEKDKQALKEANDNRPDYDLLKARFYCDGGYYDKALAQLKGKQEGELKLLRDKIELNYRLGRIYEKMNKFNDAIAWYQKAINIGKTSTYYYAANAALSIGGIYEYIKDDYMAANYYKQALDMRNHEYQSSIDTQAKDGLERMHR
ncbi:Tetratricopeptide repeat-containing protein [Mucilaginibacter mallensis]|uniref:Tetratricopeptide repeat-containing protein n=1 Tax=Mucilaginibacter mallensis TaxID=652787 RepID=A0A1H1QKI1_MUCMA|nr:tetratricopeptide repeat protein [Mucilaginibacter mallensis]SDS23906.1 Tetratricopeptide repeat-containing protein [Mucilaginibacter mallensis]